VRFHGKADEWYKYEYSEEELQAWAKTIRRLDARRVFVYFNNDYEANAARNCLRLQELLNN